MYIIIYIYIYIILQCIYIYIIRRPRPLPRQGRRLGPPEVWNLALGSQARRTPSRQHLCQLHAPAIYMLLLFARPQTLQTLRRPPRQQLLQLQLHAPAICFSGGSRLPFARPQTPQTPQTLQTLPQASKQASKHASKATTLTATCPCHLNASNPPAGLQGNNSYSYMLLPSVFQGVQDCRLPALKPPKRFQPFRRPPSRPPRQQLLQLQLHAPAICFSGGSRLPSNPPNASNASAGLQAGLQGNNSYSYMPLPSVFQGVQDCRLPALKPPKRFQPSRRPPRQQLLQLHAPAICFSGGSRLPFARPQTPQSFQPSRRPPRQQLLQLHAPAI